MPISQSDYIGLACPACGAHFEADAWTLVDAAERSDLAQALRDGSLNVATCPKCGVQTAAGAALLFHDPAGRRVYFAVPPNVDEYVWRERAQELHHQLVASLPEDERRPYLADVQVEQELDGVRRALLRHDRRRGARAQAAQEAARPGDQKTSSENSKLETVDPQISPAPSPQSAVPNPQSLIDALRALLAADNDTEFDTIMAENPALLDDDADQVVRELADLSYADGERDVAAALRELRIVLTRLRAGGDRRPATDDRQPTPDAQINPPSSFLRASSSMLSDSAYQALLHAASADTLLAATRDYPALLELWADDDLAARIEAALDESNERLARTIETRREGLDELRAQLSERTVVTYALQALLAAEGEDAVAGILSAHPILLTDTAQDALSQLAAAALTRDDRELAGQVAGCQALLRTVRAGLEEH
ncbi:MAG: CpXC domain-containing protein [Roseiflexaceae bacterium]